MDIFTRLTYTSVFSVTLKRGCRKKKYNSLVSCVVYWCPSALFMWICLGQCVIPGGGIFNILLDYMSEGLAPEELVVLLVALLIYWVAVVEVLLLRFHFRPRI